MTAKDLRWVVGLFRTSAKIGEGDMAREIFSEYHFKEDGTYEMKGYPTVAEKGAVEVAFSCNIAFTLSRAVTSLPFKLIPKY